MITLGLFGFFFPYAIVKRPDHRCFDWTDIQDALLRALMCRHGALLWVVDVPDGEVLT